MANMWQVWIAGAGFTGRLADSDPIFCSSVWAAMESLGDLVARDSHSYGDRFAMDFADALQVAEEGTDPEPSFEALGHQYWIRRASMSTADLALVLGESEDWDPSDDGWSAVR